MNLRNLLNHPSYLIAFANAVIALALAFGVDLSTAQQAGILGVINTGVVIVLAVTDRTRATA